jgi:hypothetical protein
MRHAHLAAPEQEGCSYNELHTNCLYADTETKENAFRYFRMLFALNFLTMNTVFNYILI